jgi:hypothetical protein
MQNTEFRPRVPFVPPWTQLGIEHDRFLLHIVNASVELAACIFIHHPSAGAVEVKQAYTPQNA